MARFIAKFGGTSLADTDCFQQAANTIKSLVDLGHEIVVVVSAMAGETDRLLALAKTLQSTTDTSSARDVVVSSGEQASSGLFALALSALGIQSQVFQGWQIPIITNDVAGKSQIESIDPSALTATLKSKKVCIVSGFQGVTKSGAITTFGRGGSDVTAVLLAAVLDADECRLYKDVDGILSSDPKLVKNPIIMDQIGILELLEQCSQGAKIIHPRAVQAAKDHNVTLRITPTFPDPHGKSKGTLVPPEANIELSRLESSSISGIVCNQNEVLFTIPQFDAGSSSLATLFSHLTAKNITVDMVLYNENHSLSFTVPQEDCNQTLTILKSCINATKAKMISQQDRVAKIAVIGSGIKTHAEVIARVYQTLHDLGISIYGLTTSEMKINILVSQDYAQACTRALHDVFFITKTQNQKSF